jgi:hypothetical protein
MIVQKTVSSQTFVAVIAVAVVIVAGIMWWVYRAPSAPVTNPGKPISRSAMMQQHGPTSDEAKLKAEWKKTHPDAVFDNH